MYALVYIECIEYTVQHVPNPAMIWLFEWLTDKRPPEDGGMTIAHPSSVIQHSMGAINF